MNGRWRDRARRRWWPSSVALALVVAVALLVMAPIGAVADAPVGPPASALVDDAATVVIDSPVMTATGSALAPVALASLAHPFARSRGDERLWLLTLLVLVVALATSPTWARPRGPARARSSTDPLVLLPGRRGPPPRH